METVTLDEARVITETVIRYQDDPRGYRPQNGILLGLWARFPEHDWPELVMETNPEWGSQNNWYDREEMTRARDNVDDD